MLADSEKDSIECFCSLMRICSYIASKLATLRESVLLLQTYRVFFVEVPLKQKWNDAAQKMFEIHLL